LRVKSLSLIALTAATIATAGCASSGYDDGYGGRGYQSPNYGPSGQNNIDRSDRWRRRYSRTYSYNDDVYYQQCRNGPDPAGVIAGALIGGLLGNAVGSGGNRTGATVAGVILGGAVGAALTSNLDCEDRSYAYKTYYDGFNSERPGSRYEWRNPHNDHRGEFRLDNYYNDPDGFRCADFTQTVYIDGRPRQANGRACRQPDGSWAVVD